MTVGESIRLKLDEAGGEIIDYYKEFIVKYKKTAVLLTVVFL